MAEKPPFGLDGCQQPPLRQALAVNEVVMESKDIRPFIPVKDFEASKSFYEALGFTSDDATNEMTIMSNGVCTFFLYKSDNTGHKNNFMFQLPVPSIKNTLNTIKNSEGINIIV